MADPIKGLSAKIYVSAADSDGSYSQIGCMQSIDCDITPATADDSEMGDTAGSAMATLGQFKGSCSGYLKPDDAGQAIILNTSVWLSGGHRWIKWCYDGTNGWKCSCKIVPTVSSKQGSDLASLKIDFEAAGGVAPVAA
jgi:hypothetical protein